MYVEGCVRSFVPCVLYIQFCNDVVVGMFPVSQEKLLKLAALRLQYLDGDCTPGSTMYFMHLFWIILEPLSNDALEIKTSL